MEELMRKPNPLSFCVLITCFILTGCGASAAPADTSTATVVPTADASAEPDDIVGGWTVNEGALPIEENPEVLEMYHSLPVKEDYEPIALLGTQVVSGTNYSILVKRLAPAPDAAPPFVIMTIYQDLDGNADMVSVNSIRGLDGPKITFTEDWNTETADDALSAMNAFGSATAETTDVTYEPIAYVGQFDKETSTQYYVVCRITPVKKDAVSNIGLVVIIQTGDGNAEIAMDGTIEIPLGE